MNITSENLINEVRDVIRITKKSNYNTEINILKITNHRTKISKRELKIFLDKYANDHWNVATSEGNNTIFYTNRLTLRMSDDCISLGEE